MNTSDDNYTDLLLEQIRDQNKAVLEAVGDMQKHVAKIPAIEERLDKLQDDITVIKAAVTDQGKQLLDHERRITQLKTRAA